MRIQWNSKQPGFFRWQRDSLIHQGWVGVGTLEAQILEGSIHWDLDLDHSMKQDWCWIGVGSWIRLVWIQRVSESMQTRLGYIQFHAVLQSFCSHGLAVDFSNWCWQIEVLDFFLVLAQILEELLILASNGHFGGPADTGCWRCWRRGLDPRHTGFIDAQHFEQHQFRSLWFNRQVNFGSKGIWAGAGSSPCAGIWNLGFFSSAIEPRLEGLEFRHCLVSLPLSSSFLPDGWELSRSKEHERSAKKPFRAKIEAAPHFSSNWNPGMDFGVLRIVRTCLAWMS